jgi:hypothetical protein
MLEDDDGGLDAMVSKFGFCVVVVVVPFFQFSILPRRSSCGQVTGCPARNLAHVNDF